MKQNSEGFHPVGNAILSLHTLDRTTLSRLECELKRVPGIMDVDINHAAVVVQVKFDSTKLRSEDIRSIVKNLGNAPALGH
jgi:copper chaperone CopZ